MRVFWLVIIILVLLLLTACSGTKVSISGNSFNDMPDISIQKTFVMPKAITTEEERTVEDNYPVLPVIVENLDKQYIMKNLFKKITDPIKKAGSKITDGAKGITSKAVDGVKGVGSKVSRSVDVAKGKVTKLTQFKPKK